MIVAVPRPFRRVGEQVFYGLAACCDCTLIILHAFPSGVVNHPDLCRLQACGLHEHKHLVHLRQR
jgi:hypothetical protein